MNCPADTELAILAAWHSGAATGLMIAMAVVAVLWVAWKWGERI